MLPLDYPRGADDDSATCLIKDPSTHTAEWSGLLVVGPTSGLGKANLVLPPFILACSDRACRYDCLDRHLCRIIANFTQLLEAFLNHLSLTRPCKLIRGFSSKCDCDSGQYEISMDNATTYRLRPSGGRKVVLLSCQRRRSRISNGLDLMVSS
jgi:hypothetical protein